MMEDSISRHLRSLRHLSRCSTNSNRHPCHARALEAIDIIPGANSNSNQDEDEPAVSTFTVIIIAICVLFVLGVVLMGYCAFQKGSNYDPEQASQTRRPGARRTAVVRNTTTDNTTNNNNNVPQSNDERPPDPRRMEKITVSLYYGTIHSGDDDQMKMRKASSGRFTKKKTKFEPRQPNPEDECPICCDDFSPGEAYVISKACNHMYHKRCIEQWTVDERKDDCPVCRQSFLPSSALPPPMMPPNSRRR
ncbi:unnamed protein product [Cylindrotheca closterium]|uniref:RING-type domain-containing protein n=1 Tax=Cylindrotheca closterium TaxID=2856 RepID=A0AAD2FHR9_9STRA|nr:unnamed protein product [Cylindrotheca closterium]